MTERLTKFEAGCRATAGISAMLISLGLALLWPVVAAWVICVVACGFVMAWVWWIIYDTELHRRRPPHRSVRRR